MLSPHQWTRESPLERERLSVEMLRKKISLVEAVQFFFHLIIIVLLFPGLFTLETEDVSPPIVTIFLLAFTKENVSSKDRRTGVHANDRRCLHANTNTNNEGISSDHLFR